MDINVRLRQVIDYNNMSIKEFSDICDLKYRTLQNYLSGERKPDAENLIKIATHLGVNLNWLLTGEGEPFIKKPNCSTGAYKNLSFKHAPSSVLHENKAVYVVGGGEHLNEREKQLVEDFRSANEQGQAAIEGAAKAMARVAALEAFKAG